MRRTQMMALALAMAGALVPLSGVCAESVAPPQVPQGVDPQDFEPFTADQLDDLVAPVALYADPLLAQVLLAATFPDEIAAAARYVRTNGTDGVDYQPWDVSVKAVAHYPTVLNMMDTRMDWATALGQAYAAQSTDVMQAVQRMRQMARAQGNLISSPEQQVLVSDGYIRIWPASPRYIYVPVYDPAVVFVRPVFVRPGFRAYFGFGAPFPIGSWLIYDWDWPQWRIVYTGWNGGGWIARSRPFVRITNVYINPVHRRVWFNRAVLARRPDYGRVRHYENIHPGVRFGDRHGSWGERGRGVGRRSGESAGGGSQRRAVPRPGSRGRPGAIPAPRPVPVRTRPPVQRPRVVPIDRRPRTERPSEAAPGQARRRTDPPGQARRPTNPPGQARRPTNPPGQERRPTNPPGQERRPTNPPGQQGRARSQQSRPGWRESGRTAEQPRGRAAQSRPAAKQPRGKPAQSRPAAKQQSKTRGERASGRPAQSQRGKKQGGSERSRGHGH